MSVMSQMCFMLTCGVGMSVHRSCPCKHAPSSIWEGEKGFSVHPSIHAHENMSHMNRGCCAQSPESITNVCLS